MHNTTETRFVDKVYPVAVTVEILDDLVYQLTEALKRRKLTVNNPVEFYSGMGVRVSENQQDVGIAKPIVFSWWGSTLGFLTNPKTILRTIPDPGDPFEEELRRVITSCIDTNANEALEAARVIVGEEKPGEKEHIQLQRRESKKRRYPQDPLDLKTSAFEPMEILYDDGHFVIAMGIWKKGKLGVGCRWYDNTGVKVGYPNGFGHPQWMNLPIGVTDIVKSDNPMYPDQISLTFRGKKSF